MSLPVGAIHHVPGRIRIRLPFLKKNAETLAEVRRFLEGLEGVTSVQENVLTGSLLLHYDCDENADFYDRMMNSVKENFGLMAAAVPHLLAKGGLEAVELSALDGEVPSGASRLLGESFESLDRRIRRATDNGFDLKSLVPLGLLGAAVLRIGAQAATPLWVTLAIFSFSSFIAMHPDVINREKERKHDQQFHDNTVAPRKIQHAKGSRK